MIKYDDLPLQIQNKVLIKLMLAFPRIKENSDAIKEVLGELTKLQKALYGIKEENDN